MEETISKTLTVTSLSEYLNALSNPIQHLKANLIGDQFFEDATKTYDSDTLQKVANYEVKCRTFFRGNANKDWSLTPSIFRESNLFLKEHEFYHNTLIDRFSDFDASFSNIDILVKMQHHGIPTRLLDVTENPLVSLYFACISEKDEKGNELDGCIWILPVEDKNILEHDSDFLDLQACLPRLDFPIGTMSFLTSFAALNFFIEGYKDSKSTDILPSTSYFLSQHPHIYELIKKLKALPTKYNFSFLEEDNILDFYKFLEQFNKNYVFIPPRKHPRLNAQSGALILCNFASITYSNNGLNISLVQNNIELTDLRLSDISPTEYFGCEKIIIPGNQKANFREELKKLQITQASLFPDLQNYAEFLKKNI